MSDIINVIYKLFGNNDELINEISLYKKIGFVLIDTYSNKNLFVKYDTTDGVKYKFLLYDELFTNPNPQNRYSWLLNKLYCTTSFSKTKTPLKDVYNKINMKMMKETGTPDDQLIFMHCLPAFHDRSTKVGEEIYEKYGLSEMEVNDEFRRVLGRGEVH